MRDPEVIKKPKGPEPIRLQETWDAKVTVHGGPFIAWALRNGETTSPARVSIMRKTSAGDVTKALEVDESELPALGQLLTRVQLETLPKLAKYGLAPVDD